MELRLISTTYEGKERITREQTIPFCDDGGREEQLINLYPQVIYQQMDGFGGAITDSAAYIYSLMNPEQKKQMLDEYFGQGTMKYRFVRIPIDSCDFSLSHYEADGDEADASFESFSFARVEKYILPMLADAEAAYGGRLEIMLSPWSPPAYMKTNGERNHGGKLKACYWKRWAEYICRYVEEYRSRGFNVTMLTLQNEPKAVQTWDSCIYTSEDESRFVRDYLGPKLEEAGFSDIGIFVWDHNKEEGYQRFKEVIADEKTRKYVKGEAIHWYTGDHFETIEMVRKKYPEKEIFFTEGCVEYSRFADSGEIYKAEMYAHDILGNLNAGINASLDWNLLLDEKGGPNHVGNFCAAPIMCVPGEDSYEKRLTYYYIGHFSRYIKEGAVKIGTSRYTDGIEVTAFLNPDGERVAVILNKSEKEVPYTLREMTKDAGYQGVEGVIAPHSIQTIVY